MKKCLILLTTDFPYKRGEPFLENEINFLSSSFDKIIILSQEVNPGEQPQRTVPENVDYYNPAKYKRNISKALDYAFGASHLLVKTEAGKSDKKYTDSIKKKLFTEYFEQRSLRKSKDSLKVLQKYNFDDYDEIVIYSYWFFIVCRVGSLLKEYFESNGKKVRFISRAHRYDLYEGVNPLNFLPCRNLLSEKVDRVYACSVDGCEHLKETIPDYKDKFECSYLGTFDHGISSFDNTFHIVTCARTVPVKRIDRLIKVLKMLEDDGKEFYWTHIGGGELQEEIESLAQKTLNKNSYEFLGQIPNTEIYDYYSSHPISVFVNISSSEGLPVSIMEASSFSIPVIATDVGGTREIVVDSYNGFLIENEFSDSDLKESLLKFMNMDSSKYKNFRENAREYWQKNFNAENNYRLFSQKISQNELV